MFFLVLFGVERTPCVVVVEERRGGGTGGGGVSAEKRGVHLLVLLLEVYGI